MFDREPARYVPLYGGYCGYGLGDGGYLYPADPLNYKIVEPTKELVLFYRDDSVNTLTLWEENEPTYKAHADDLWRNGTYDTTKLPEKE
jgi:hypothetical protein